jgi:outer membrane protein assembly factor BamB
LLRRAGETVVLTALTHEGRDVWRRDVTKSTEPHGYGASPVLVNDVVCVINDNEDAGDLTAVDQKSGEIRWQVPRPNGQSGFSTPCLLDAAGGKKLLVTASTGGGLIVVDPITGMTAWQMLEKELPQRCVSSPIVAGSMVLISCGLVNNGLHLIAVDAGQGGATPHEAYRIKENVPNVTTPIVVDDMLFLWQDRGIVSCHNVKTNERYWRERIGGNFNSSPISVGNRLYCPSRAGEMVVLAADKKYRLLARFPIGEACSATPAVAHDRLYLRTESSLMCIGEPASASE